MDPTRGEHHEGDEGQEEIEEGTDGNYGLDHVPDWNLKCRFYENEFPEENEVIMGLVTRVDKLTGYYIQLLEYNEIEGLVMLSEYSRKRVKSVHRLIKVGKIEPLIVTKVDEERGFIDLSRKRVNPDDVKACEERYNQHLKVHNIMRQTAAWLEEDLESLYKRVGWPLGHKFKSTYEAFMISLNEPDRVFDEIKIDDKTKELLMGNIKKRMKPLSCKIRADFEITWFTFEGIDAVKSALTDSLEKAKEIEDMEITIRLIKSPLYEIATHTTKIQQGIDELGELLSYIEEKITASRGKFKIINPPNAIGAKEDEDIENMIRQLNEQQDDDSSSRNGEEDNEEGMSMHIEGVDDETDDTSKHDTEEEKKDLSDDDDDDEN